MKTCFIVINYNDYSSTETLVQNVKNYKILDSIILVDNCSTNDSVKKLKKLENKKVKVIQTDVNKGYGYGINLGVIEAKKIYKDCNIIISNPDVIIKSENDIKQLLSHLKQKDIGLVGPTILEKQEKNRGWKIPTPLDDILLNIVYLHRFLRKKLILYSDSYYNGKTSIVDAASGCFFLTTASILEEIDYFDDNVFLYYEENIIGKKLKEKGYTVVIDNEVTILHNHSVSIDKSMKKISKYKMLKESQYYFQTKYNHANIISRLFLLLTNKISLFVLYFVYFIQDHKKRGSRS